MYEAFYRLANDPFRLLPDPGICFPHRSCAKAWAYLRYALKRGEGIVVVTGPPGSGKTTLAERLLNELNPAKTVSVRLIANDLNATDLLRKLAYSFGLPAEGMDRAMLAHRIERYLIELEQSQRRALVLIDEAQTLSHHSLEAMRLLTDLQSRSRPVLQLFLLGQEELEGVMSAPGMAQFQQRVIASSRLHTMDLTETKAYLEYRLGFADWAGDPLINGPAVMAIFRYSQGLPRHVNKICSRLLLHGCTEEKHSLDEQDVLAVVQDLRDELLAPMNGEREVAATIVGSAFESVYELALVPNAQPKITATPNPHPTDTVPAAEQREQTASDTLSQTRTGTPGRQWQSQAAGRGIYGAEYQRPIPMGRRVRRVLRAPAALVRRLWDLGVRSALLLREFLTRAGREVVVLAEKGIRMVRGWTTDPGSTAWPLRLRAQLSALPSAAVAGLGMLLVTIVGLIVWVGGDDLGATLAGDGVVDSGGEVRLDDGRSPDSVGRLGVLEQTADYLGVVVPIVNAGQLQERGLLDVSLYRGPAASGQAAVDGGASLFGEDGETATVGQRVELLAERSGVEGDLRNVVLGKVAGDVADLLVGGVARSGSSLGVWALAKDPRDQASAADVSASPIAQSAGGAARKNEAAADEAGRQTQEIAGANAGMMEAAGSGSNDENGAGIADRVEKSLSSRQIALIVSDERNGAKGYVRFLPTQESEQASAVVAVHNGPEKDVSQMDEAAATSVVALGAPIPAVGAASVVLEDSVPALTAVQQEEVAQLLAKADAALARDRLTRPRSGNAYSYYQSVLEIDPQNAMARAGLDRIVSRYSDLARWSLDHQAFAKAEQFVERALRLRPGNAEMLALRDKIDNAIAEAQAAELAEAELARIAFEMRQQPPVVEQKERPKNVFDSLMRFVNGEN